MTKLRDGVLTYVGGASGSGKSGWLKDQLRKRQRIMIWDPEGEYRCSVRITNTNDLIDAVVSLRAKPIIIAYTGNLQHFSKFCECAYIWCRFGAKANVYSTVVCEELADVTHQGKAPDNWGTIIRRARKRHTDVFAVSQSPSESDKTTLRNAAVIHCCRLGTYADRQTMARIMDIDIKEIEIIKADIVNKKFGYIHRDMRLHVIENGIWTPK